MRKSSLTSTVCTALVLMPLALSPLNAVAQPALNRAELNTTALAKIQPTQLSQLKLIAQRQDQRLLQAFRGKEALKASMEAELRAIQQEPDEDKREGLIKAYQAKNKTAYQTALRESNVDLNAMAREMAVAAPDMDFRVTDNLSIVAAPKMQAASRKSAPASGSLPAPTPSRQVKNLVTEDYTIKKDVGCGAIAGGEINVSGGYMTNKAVAISTGACENEGEYLHEFRIRSNETVDATMTVDMTARAQAVGIYGSAASTSSVSARIVGSESQPGDGDGVSCTAFAPALWVANEECELLNVRLNARFTRPGTYALTAQTRTYILTALNIGGASGEARIKKLRGTLVTETR